MWLSVVPGAPVEDLASALIDIPSVSGDERAITDQIEAVLRGVPHLEVLRLGNALVARTMLGRSERVIVAGHVDTVPIKDNVPSVRSDDGEWIIGRGSVDMKCGVAVQLALAVELDFADPGRDVGVLRPGGGRRASQRLGPDRSRKARTARGRLRDPWRANVGRDRGGMQRDPPRRSHGSRQGRSQCAFVEGHQLDSRNGSLSRALLRCTNTRMSRSTG